MLAALKLVAAGMVVLVHLVKDASGLYSSDVDDIVSTLNKNRHLKQPQSLLPHFVNPFLPVLLCDWHYGGVPDTFGGDSTWSSLVTNPLNTSNIRNVHPCDSICVDVTAFESFVSEILPLLEVKFLLFTHRWCLPPLSKSTLTDAVRAHRNVAHWFAQNPLYVENERYSAFPYGIEPAMLETFGEAFLAFHQGGKQKLQTLEQLHLSASHPSRHRLIARSEAASKHARLKGRAFYEKIANTRFLISPHGDRPDCYRHWEAIGLGAIPVANINSSLYGPLFGNDMIYMDEADQMLQLLDNPGQLQSRYIEPRSQRVLTAFWNRKVIAKKRQCLESFGVP